jgi:hypothetical protein
MMYYATESTGNFFGIQSEYIPGTQRILMYLGYALGNSTATPSQCSVCPRVDRSNTAFYYNIVPQDGTIQANNITNRYAYAATQQAWYTSAKKLKQNEALVTWTDPYIFGSRDKIGITGVSITR